MKLTTRGGGENKTSHQSRVRTTASTMSTSRSNATRRTELVSYGNLRRRPVDPLRVNYSVRAAQSQAKHAQSERSVGTSHNSLHRAHLIFFRVRS